MLVRQSGNGETRTRNYQQTLNLILRLLSTHEHTHLISMGICSWNPTKLHKCTLVTLSYHYMLSKHQLSRVRRGAVMRSNDFRSIRKHSFNTNAHKYTTILALNISQKLSHDKTKSIKIA